jgi:hypothetical protein
MSWKLSFVCCLSVLLPGIPARSDDWPGWRGVDRSGVSLETGLLKSWPAGGPKLVWKASQLGEGYSTPSVAGGRIYVMGAKLSQNEEFLLALDTKDGKQIWTTKVGAVGPNPKGTNYPGPRCTPTVDGERIYTLGSAGDLVCVDLAGKIIWQKNLAKDLGGRRGAWAFSESPLIDGNVLVCTPGGEKSSLAALNKKTGAVIWLAEVPKGARPPTPPSSLPRVGAPSSTFNFSATASPASPPRTASSSGPSRKAPAAPMPRPPSSTTGTCSSRSAAPGPCAHFSS